PIYESTTICIHYRVDHALAILTFFFSLYDDHRDLHSFPTRRSSDLQYVKGIGPKKAYKLNKLGIFTLKDLLFYFPRQFEDRNKSDRKSTRLNSSHVSISYAVFCLKKKNN